MHNHAHTGYNHKSGKNGVKSFVFNDIFIIRKKNNATFYDNIMFASTLILKGLQ